MYRCIINFEDSEIIQELERLGYSCIKTISSARVSEPICRHADVLYLKLDDKNIIVSSCQKENIQYLTDNGFTVTTTNKLKPGYKTESYLNIINLKDTIVCNPKTAIECDFFNNYIEKIYVNQGYTRCSTIIVNENAFITEDEGIYKALSANKKDCLLLTKGHIRLKGYEYGFIGGCALMLKDNSLFFFGDIMLHPEKDKIIEFLNKYGVTIHFIKDKPLTDIGGAIII